jgi:ABC-type multidrug transport system fused ATPase/permease subunit
MATAKDPGQQNGQKLDDIVKDADEYYNYLKGRHVHETRLDVVVVSIVVWFASFVVLGVGAYVTIKGSMVIDYLLVAFLAAIAIGVAAGFITFLVRRKRGFKFAELGFLIQKMKQGAGSSEDGLRLMDAVHQASLAVKKRRLDSAFEYAVIAFAVVTLFGLNAGIGALAGVIVYLYFRFEALREYERGDERYENSKRELLHSF